MPAIHAQPSPAAGPRPPWTTSRLRGSPNPPPPYVTEPAFRNLKFENPVELAFIPGSGRLFVMEVQGRIFSFQNRPDATNADLFADFHKLVPNFNSCFGMAFHPGFATNREVYICYTLQGPPAKGSHVSRFKVSRTDPPVIEPGSEQLLITWPAGGHNAGSIHFGPDGYLYIAAGDSADPSPPDPLNTGQDITDLLSSIMRIDVDHADPGRSYRIPSDNPFVSTPGARGEIWAYGLRNPWRFSFDSVTGDLWVGDVGWDLWEMIHRVTRGGNYGWSIMEGPQPVKPSNPRGPTPILPPIAVHPHTEARSITGGYVYHGARLAGLKGAYIYGDYMTGRIWGLRYDGQTVTWKQELAVTPLRIVAFGVDEADELYAIDYASGTLSRLAVNPAVGANPVFPRRLSDTGLFTSVREQTPAPGVLPYSIRSELWSDGAIAERWVALPGNSRLTRLTAADWETGEEVGGWRFPTNGILAKTLSLELQPGNPASRRRLETQVLHFDGHNWHPYVYEWNDAQTDAVLAGAEPHDRAFEIADPAAEKGRRQQTWHYASQTECVLCHCDSAAGQFGFAPWELDRAVAASPAKTDQLGWLERNNVFDGPVTRTNLTAASDLEWKVRAYLDINCSHCHRPNAGGAATINARLTTPLKLTGLIDARPSQGDFGLPDARIVAAGHPERSVMLFRLAKMGSGHMPHFGSGMTDINSVRLIRDWILSLNSAESTPAFQLAALQSGKATDEALAPFVQTPANALVTALALDDPAQKIPASAQSQVVRLARAGNNGMTADLFERFIPEAQRIAKLGTAIRPAELLALTGRAEMGRRVFFDIAQCGTCHQINGQGKPVGPDLALKTAKMTRAQILENILEPSRTIEPEYVVQLARTRDGETASGFLRERTAAEIVLRDAAGQDVRLKLADVQSVTPQKLSLMPEGLLQNLTAQEAADLLEFVMGLAAR